jgi:hypothetical protein
MERRRVAPCSGVSTINGTSASLRAQASAASRPLHQGQQSFKWSRPDSSCLPLHDWAMEWSVVAQTRPKPRDCTGIAACETGLALRPPALATAPLAVGTKVRDLARQLIAPVDDLRVSRKQLRFLFSSQCDSEAVSQCDRMLCL